MAVWNFRRDWNFAEPNRMATTDDLEGFEPGEGGGGAVDSVNGQVGVVVLDADDVGAAPAAHTHTAGDVGAAPAGHTHTAGDVGAASAAHTHTAGDVGAIPAGEITAIEVVTQAEHDALVTAGTTVATTLYIRVG